MATATRARCKIRCSLRPARIAGRAAQSGAQWDECVERLLRGLQKTTYPSLETPDALTPRELEVTRLMAGGYSNKEIAGALGMSEGTVKNHVSSVLSKLGVRDRTRAVLRALELGYV